MVLQHYLRNRPGKVDAFKYFETVPGVLFDDGKFQLTEPPRLGENLGRDSDLVDFMNNTSQVYSLNLLLGKLKLFGDCNSSLSDAPLKSSGIGIGISTTEVSAVTESSKLVLSFCSLSSLS